MADYKNIFYMLAAGAQTTIAIRWLWKRIRVVERNNRFVESLALNHLPHIYTALRLLCEKQGIFLAPEPPIEFEAINGRKGR